ncbi:Ubiquitin fusion degradation protein 1 like protein [Cucumispora dikerogammari]|nr:Ubiquitin fusion degradation protein 1 like protein [Cucumispora dikerogammari]
MFFGLFSQRQNSSDFEWKLKVVKMPRESPHNYGGKVILPEFILEILTFSSIPLPWTFKISNPQSQLTTHVGVLDFTAPFGKIIVPRWLFKQLSLINNINNNEISLKYKSITPGKFCQLLPQQASWSEVENAKKTLEYNLVNYPILTEGDTIDLNFEDYGIMGFTVLQVDNPRGMIYIIDTDLSVDLKPPLDTEGEDLSNKTFKVSKLVDKETGVEVVRCRKFGFLTENFFKKK